MNKAIVAIIAALAISNTAISFYKDIIKKNNTHLEIVHKENKDILMSLEIDKINLQKDIYFINSKNNNIDKSVEIMKESKLPYVRGGNLILGAHSGNGRNAYFNELIKLGKDDLVYIYHDNIKYTYIVSTIYEDDKNGKLIIRRDWDKNTLTLFTCKNNDKKHYLVIIAYLVEIAM